MQRVEARNLGLRIFTDTDRSATVDSDRKIVIKCLDSSTVPYNLDKILDQCKNKLLPAELIDCFCEWAVTSLRAGIYRVYLTLSLLRWAYEEGLNIQEPIMSFLARFDASVRESKHDLYLLISELVRMRLFSVPAYMTWLIARGALSKINAIVQVIKPIL
jgi:mediator of RNA polymerase II transcription subunit 12